MALALLWKEKGVRSQDALADLLKNQPFGARKGRKGIGHAGTLDPFAEGWLLVGVDEGTKFLSIFQGFDKEYDVEMLLGATSRSFDTDEEMAFPESSLGEDFFGTSLEAEEKFRSFLASKVGTFDQVPPQFSAIRVGGNKRAYDYARKGETVELKARSATILSAEHKSLKWDSTTYSKGVFRWKFTVKVSSGTYIRALSRDWAQELISFPGMLTQLVRSEIAGLGRHHKRSGVHYLSIEDLSPFFEMAPISEFEVQQIRRGGRWLPRETEKAELLLVPETLEIVAFTEAPEGALGRVFLNDPLRL